MIYEMHPLPEPRASRRAAPGGTTRAACFLSDEALMHYLLRRFSRDLGSLMQRAGRTWIASTPCRPNAPSPCPLVRAMLENAIAGRCNCCLRYLTIQLLKLALV
jgi:hypothetical protein